MNIFEQIQNQMNQHFNQQQEASYLLPTDLNTVVMMLNKLGSPQPDVTKLEGCNIIAVLKNNVPFNVANDPVIIDLIIEKEGQTHLDATHIGDTGNASFYYKSEILKKWFWWNTSDGFWQECSFNYYGMKLIPITINK